MCVAGGGGDREWQMRAKRRKYLCVLHILHARVAIDRSHGKIFCCYGASNHMIEVGYSENLSVCYLTDVYDCNGGNFTCQITKLQFKQRSGVACL